MPYCPNCGKCVGASDNYCSSCGRAQSSLSYRTECTLPSYSLPELTKKCPRCNGKGKCPESENNPGLFALACVFTFGLASDNPTVTCELCDGEGIEKKS